MPIIPVKMSFPLLEVNYQYNRDSYVHCGTSVRRTYAILDHPPTPPSPKSATTSAVWTLKYATLGTCKICADRRIPIANVARHAAARTPVNIQLCLLNIQILQTQLTGKVSKYTQHCMRTDEGKILDIGGSPFRRR